MANVNYTDLIDEVLPNLAADPSDPVTQHAIKRAVIQLCEQAWIWKHLPAPINVAAGVSAYTIPVPADADVVVVIDAAYNGKQLENRELDWLNSALPTWRTETGTPAHFTQVDTEQIILAPVPEAALTGGLVMTTALAPTQTSTDFPAWICNQYLYAIADGALAKLMTMPGKPWTDVPNGLDRRAQFDAAVAGAKLSAINALGRAPLRVRAQH